MSRINPEGQITRKERLVTVIAIIGAVLVHLVALFGWGRIYQWTQEEQKKERLMVIRRVRDIGPLRETIAAPPLQRPGPSATEGKVGEGRKAAPPDAKVKERGPEPPKEPEISPAMEEELQAQQPDAPKTPEHGENVVSVVTDLPGASFIVGGPAEYRGSGTMWVRKGAPPGTYVVTFNPVAGYATPPVQTKELAERGQVVFVGKYRRSTEVVVDSNVPGASVTIYRPDGRPLDLHRPGRALLDDLPPGTYTAVFTDVPGHITPAPLSRPLTPGGKLSFFAEYKDATSAGSSGAGEEGPASGERLGKYGAVREPAGAGGGDTGSGRGSGSGKPQVKTAAGPKEAGLDRRVQIVVTSYPRSRIEDHFDSIPYPEMIIRKSSFQQGWCQVYLIITTSDSGEVETVSVQRPSPDERPRFEPLIKAVESSVRGWDYDRVKAEVHVDVRFYVE
jgi:hypothetical protein